MGGSLPVVGGLGERYARVGSQDFPKGLRHGQSLLVYHTLAEMRDLILHYLHHSDERKRIATRGWEIAMGYHRSWHVMESLVFGDPVFQV